MVLRREFLRRVINLTVWTAAASPKLPGKARTPRQEHKSLGCQDFDPPSLGKPSGGRDARSFTT